MSMGDLKLDPEPYIAKYGEKYRRLITSALEFLQGKSWYNPDDFDVDEYLKDLVERSVD